MFQHVNRLTSSSSVRILSESAASTRHFTPSITRPRYACTPALHLALGVQTARCTPTMPLSASRLPLVQRRPQSIHVQSSSAPRRPLLHDLGASGAASPIRRKTNRHPHPSHTHQPRPGDLLIDDEHWAVVVLYPDEHVLRLKVAHDERLPTHVSNLRTSPLSQRLDNEQ